MERSDLWVKRQIARINGEVVEAPLKTKNDYRTLSLAKDTVDVFKSVEEKIDSILPTFSAPANDFMRPTGLWNRAEHRKPVCPN